MSLSPFVFREKIGWIGIALKVSFNSCTSRNHGNHGNFHNHPIFEMVRAKESRSQDHVIYITESDITGQIVLA